MKNTFLVLSTTLALLGVVGVARFVRAPRDPASRSAPFTAPTSSLAEIEFEAPAHEERTPIARVETPDRDARPGAPFVSAEIHGRALHWETRAAVAGLSVGAVQPGSRVELACVDAEGRFTLEPAAVPPLLQAWGSVSGDSWCTVRAGISGRAESRGDVLVLVAPSRPCSVHVSDASGAPLTGVHVSLEIDPAIWRDDAEVQTRTSRLDATCVTDAKGSGEFADVPGMPGVSLQAMLAGYETVRVDLPAKVGSREGGHIEIELRRLGTLVPVHGHVLCADDAPAPAAEVEWGRTRVRADAFGAFTIRAEIGSKTEPLVARLKGHVDGTADLSGVRAGDEVEIRLGPPSTGLSGTVRDARGSRPQQAELYLYSDPETSAQPLATARIDRQGEFRFEGLAPGSYALWLVVEGRPASATRVRAEAGRTDLQLVVPGPAEIGTVGSRVSGHVLDEFGRPVAGARLRWGPQPHGHGTARTTDADGTFELEDLLAPWVLLEVETGTGTTAVHSAMHLIGPHDRREDVELRSGAR